jgi:hypothetical protein
LGSIENSNFRRSESAPIRALQVSKLPPRRKVYLYDTELLTKPQGEWTAVTSMQCGTWRLALASSASTYPTLQESTLFQH